MLRLPWAWGSGGMPGLPWEWNGVAGLRPGEGDAVRPARPWPRPRSCPAHHGALHPPSLHHPPVPVLAALGPVQLAGSARPAAGPHLQHHLRDPHPACHQPRPAQRCLPGAPPARGLGGRAGAEALWHSEMAALAQVPASPLATHRLLPSLQRLREAPGPAAGLGALCTAQPRLLVPDCLCSIVATFLSAPARVLGPLRHLSAAHAEGPATLLPAGCCCRQRQAGRAGAKGRWRRRTEHPAEPLTPPGPGNLRLREPPVPRASRWVLCSEELLEGARCAGKPSLLG
nr:uncharacterized protein LOC106044800 isoform X1 [Anser cygnoides]